MPDHRQLGANLRALREKAGLSLRQVAFRLGISAPYLSDLERGRRYWTEERRDTYLKFVKALKQRR